MDRPETSFQEPSPPEWSPGSFAEKYCTRYGIAPSQHARAVLWRALHPLAQLLYPVLALPRDCFEADYELIRTVGRMTHLRDFDLEVLTHSHHPANRSFARRILKLRVSSRRLRVLMREMLGPHLPS